MKSKPLIFLLIAVVCGVAWLLLRPRPAPAPLHPTSRQVAETQKRLAGLGQDAAKPGTGPRTLHLSESDLNVALSGSQSLQKPLSAHGVQAVQVVLQEPDSVIIHATATVHGQTQNVQISGTLAPDPKLGIRFTADGAQVGSLPLPPALVTAQANGLAARFSRQFLGHLPLSVQSVSVQKKDLVIVGIPTKASPPTASPAHH